MPYQTPGVRRNDAVNNTGVPLTHGAPANVDGFVGIAMKSRQIDPFDPDPSAAAIADGEEFVQAIGGHVPIDAPAGAQVGASVFVAPDGTVTTGATDVTGPGLLGVITYLQLDLVPPRAWVLCRRQRLT